MDNSVATADQTFPEKGAVLRNEFPVESYSQRGAAPGAQVSYMALSTNAFVLVFIIHFSLIGNVLHFTEHKGGIIVRTYDLTFGGSGASGRGTGLEFCSD